VKVFREDEEATKILTLVALERSYLKTILVVPLLAICTALTFLLFLFWYPSLRKKFFYSETNLSRATHLFVQGTCKYNDLKIRFTNFHDSMSLLNGDL